MLVALLIGKQGALATFLFPIAVCFIGVGMVVPVATAHAMAPFDKNTGIASSLLGSIQMLVAALGMLAMGRLRSRAVIDIPIVFLALAVLACLALLGHGAGRMLHPAQAV
ncbi:MAG: hypothetical protein ABI178_15645 [Rhodanobacter sp.]